MASTPAQRRYSHQRAIFHRCMAMFAPTSLIAEQLIAKANRQKCALKKADIDRLFFKLPECIQRRITWVSNVGAARMMDPACRSLNEAIVYGWRFH